MSAPPPSISIETLCHLLGFPPSTPPSQILERIGDLVQFKQEHVVCRETLHEMNTKIISLKQSLEKLTKTRNLQNLNNAVQESQTINSEIKGVLGGIERVNAELEEMIKSKSSPQKELKLDADNLSFLSSLKVSEASFQNTSQMTDQSNDNHQGNLKSEME